MANRQKILIALMVGAILFGIYELFIRPADREPVVQTDTELDRTKQFSQTMGAAIESFQLTPEELHVLELMTAIPDQSPFYEWPYGQRPKKAAPVVVDDLPQHFSYDGYIELNGTRLAVINGQEYLKGELMAEEGLIVVDILPEKVILESETTFQRYSVPFQEFLF